jgi:hypothetical protein
MESPITMMRLKVAVVVGNQRMDADCGGSCSIFKRVSVETTSGGNGISTGFMQERSKEGNFGGKGR